MKKNEPIKKMKRSSPDIPRVRRERLALPWKYWRDMVPKVDPPYFELIPERTALIPVDLQYFCASPEHGLGIHFKKTFSPRRWQYWSTNITNRVIPNNERLLSFFREHKLRIVHIQHGFTFPDGADALPSIVRRYNRIEAQTGRKPSWFPIGSLEHKPIPSVAPIEGEPIVTKRSYGAFASSGLDAILRHLQVDTLVVTGVATNACVENTARAAVDLGYDVVLVDDACGGNDPVLHDATMIMFESRFGRAMTTDEVVAELNSKLGRLHANSA